MLKINGLYKRFGKFIALNGVNLHVKKGELFGFVGSNGAGKTTTMRICVGLANSDAGQILIDDKDVTTDRRELKSLVGYVPDFFGVYDNLTALEYLDFFAGANGIYGAEADKLCKELLNLVNLSDKQDVNVDSLSRGMKQRLCLARALVHNPDLLFLDEPASGLDPRARYEIKMILKNLVTMGKTIVISSHILPELAEMCTSIGIIDRGRIILNGPIDEITKMACEAKPILIQVGGMIDETIKLLRELPLTQNIKVSQNVISVWYGGGQKDEIGLLNVLMQHSIPIISYRRQEGNLETLFMQVMGQSRQQNPDPNQRVIRQPQQGSRRTNNARYGNDMMNSPQYGQPMQAPNRYGTMNTAQYGQPMRKQNQNGAMNSPQYGQSMQTPNQYGAMGSPQYGQPIQTGTEYSPVSGQNGGNQ